MTITTILESIAMATAIQAKATAQEISNIHGFMLNLIEPLLQ